MYIYVYMYTYDASSPKSWWIRPNIPWVLHVLRKKHRINPNPMAGDVSRVSLHVWESFMEKTGTGDPVGNNMHRENEADGSVLREGPGYPMTHPWDWYIYLSYDTSPMDPSWVPSCSGTPPWKEANAGRPPHFLDDPGLTDVWKSRKGRLQLERARRKPRKRLVG